MNLNLDQLMSVNGSDQGSLFHHYAERLEPYLAPMRESARKVLEIGLAGGASLRAWSQYFPYAQIIGVDIDIKAVEDFKTTLMASAILGDASKVEFWTKFQKCWGGDWDVVCDDGAHTVHSIDRAFACGFPLLRSGGYWIVQDIHAGYTPAYRRDNNLSGLPPSMSSAELLANLIHKVNECGFEQCGQIQLEETEISEMHFSKSLVVIRKR